MRWYREMSLVKAIRSHILTVSNSSLRLVAEKISAWLHRSEDTQSESEPLWVYSHRRNTVVGPLCWVSTSEWVSHDQSARLRWFRLQLPIDGLIECSLLEVQIFHLDCHRLWRWPASSWYRSVGGHFASEILKPSAAFAAWSARSLPLYQYDLGSNIKWWFSQH